MKNVIHKMVSLVMAILLLATTTSWKVEKHYCMGHLVDVAFFVEAQNCGSDISLGDKLEITVDEKSCCSSEVIAVKGKNDVRPAFNDFDLSHEFFLVSYVYSFVGLLEPVKQRSSEFTLYNPPQIVKNIQLLDVVFLI